MSLFAPRYADGQQLDIAGVRVRLRVSRRARNVSLRVDAARGEVVAIAPSQRRLTEAAAFARTRHLWIASRALEVPASQPLTPDMSLMVLGAPWRLRPDGRRPRVIWSADRSAAVLAGCGLGQVDAQLAARGIRRQALATFTARAQAHCAALGVAPPPVAVMDARTRWGSCSPAGPRRPARIRLSWRLALAPFAVADYVVAHECAHLLEANHGPAFWSHVRSLVGEARPHRAWLRREGARLHAFGAPP